MAVKRIREEFEAYGIDSQNDAVFECKTCNRQFPSFHALGGHRASHKRPRTAAEESKEKTHECGLCGQEFSSGQALGGHMRRHRAVTAAEKIPVMKRCGSRRVMYWLDLNLTPLENDFKFLFGKMAPTVGLLL